MTVQTAHPVLRPEVYETLWHYAAERQRIFWNRVEGETLHPTTDPILQQYRFTNCYRVADRVSQYLIRYVIYNPALSAEPREVFYRILLFKCFNRIDTWEALCDGLGRDPDLRTPERKIWRELEQYREDGGKVYSNAYMMPKPHAYGHSIKHRGNLAMIRKMISDGVVEQVEAASCLEDVYRALNAYPFVGPFLAYQWMTDLNYSDLFDFNENDFCMPGPGAVNGVGKVFGNLVARKRCVEAIEQTRIAARTAFDERGLSFVGLYGRPLHMIDVQNLFCELDKYSRVAHPDVAAGPNPNGHKGTLGRPKQYYRPNPTPLEPLMFPPKWRIP